jgi:hypothetical protein
MLLESSERDEASQREQAKRSTVPRFFVLQWEKQDYAMLLHMLFLVCKLMEVALESVPLAVITTSAVFKVAFYFEYDDTTNAVLYNATNATSNATNATSIALGNNATAIAIGNNITAIAIGNWSGALELPSNSTEWNDGGSDDGTLTLMLASLLLSVLSMTYGFFSVVSKSDSENRRPTQSRVDGRRLSLFFALLVHVLWTLCALSSCWAASSLGWVAYGLPIIQASLYGVLLVVASPVLILLQFEERREHEANMEKLRG